jgi:hypothetical protein
MVPYQLQVLYTLERRGLRMMDFEGYCRGTLLPQYLLRDLLHIYSFHVFVDLE